MSLEALVQQNVDQRPQRRWMVLRNGRTIASFEFDPRVHSDDVRRALIEEKRFPPDIAVLYVGGVH